MLAYYKHKPVSKIETFQRYVSPSWLCNQEQVVTGSNLKFYADFSAKKIIRSTSHGIILSFYGPQVNLWHINRTVICVCHKRPKIMKTSPLLATFSSQISSWSSKNPFGSTRNKSSQESTSAVDRRPTCLTHLFTLSLASDGASAITYGIGLYILIFQ